MSEQKRQDIANMMREEQRRKIFESERKRHEQAVEEDYYPVDI